jgi:hypothetical protein
MHNDDEKKNLLLEQIKKAVYLRLELWKVLHRIQEIHTCTFDPEIWLEDMSCCLDSADEVTLSDVEAFCS